jgi:hypothetical protein
LLIGHSPRQFAWNLQTVVLWPEDTAEFVLADSVLIDDLATAGVP